jgi:ribonuclease E
MAEEPRKSYFTASTEAPAPQTVMAPVTVVSQTPAVAPVPQAPATPKPVSTPAAAAPLAAAAGMPKLQSFALPLAELAQVAESSGLNWVNSDAEKIAAVQAAIAAEPKAIHVPRERPAVVPVDGGPLVLVETKRDLRNMTLPFEEKELQ